METADKQEITLMTKSCQESNLHSSTAASPLVFFDKFGEELFGLASKAVMVVGSYHPTPPLPMGLISLPPHNVFYYNSQLIRDLIGQFCQP